MEQRLRKLVFDGLVATFQVDFVGLFHDMLQNRLLSSPACVEIKFSAAIALIYIKVSRGLRAKYNVIIY
jgi:hypothetical protein